MTRVILIDNPYLIPRVNAKVPGLFKDELGGDVIKEFTGLRAKLYCLLATKVQINKAKSISNSVTKRLKMSHYTKALFNNETRVCKMNLIRSIKHVLYSQQVSKLVMNRNDDKRYVLSNQIETLQLLLTGLLV